MKRVWLQILTKKVRPIEFGSIRLCQRWLKDHGYQSFDTQAFSDFFRRHPKEKVYYPRHGEYKIVKLSD